MRFAQRYAADGFAVFPVYEPAANGCSCGKAGCRGKHPRTPNGVSDATTDIKIIEGWWNKWPNASIGIATGEKSGLSVVDLDGPEGLRSGNGLRLTSNVTSLTGNGKQLFFADTRGLLRNSVKKLAPGIDIRGVGGYVVVPPSLHPNGKRYVWESAPLTRNALSSLPESLKVERSQPSTLTRAVTSKPQGWISEALKGMKNGNIDNTLVSILGRMRADNWSAEDAFVLLDVHARNAGATEGHLSEKIAHVWRKYQPNSVDVRGTLHDSQSENIDAFLSDIKKVEWICEPIIAKKSIGFVAGLPETCKTWLTIDLAVESARGSGSWLGIFAVGQNRTLFIDQERFKGETQRRFNAVIAAKGLVSSTLRDALFLKCGTTIKLDIDASFQAFRMELLTLQPTLVIVDSFATFHGSPENDRMAMQKVLNRIKELRDEIGCAFLFINHESKGIYQDIAENKAVNAFGMLGSVGIVAAAESCLTVRKIEPGVSMVHHSKSTLATASKSFTVQLIDTPDGIIVKGTL